MHGNRMKEIGRWAIPPEGTCQRNLLDANIASHKGNPEWEKKMKKTFNEASASCILQEENGANLPADTLIREYNREYNNRVFQYSLNDLPSSFNVVEAFNSFIPPSATFKVNAECDHIFALGDFLDYMTSENAPENLSAVYETMSEEVIYSFNSIDDPTDYLFSTSDGDDFGILSVSLIRHGDEVSIILLGGQVCDLEKQTKELKKSFDDIEAFNKVEPDKTLKVEAVPLIEKSNLWRTVVLVRLDLKTSTIDAKYIFQDAGRSYTGTTDDLDCYLDRNGNFINDKVEAMLKAGEVKIKKYSPLFEICKLSIYLPMFRNEFEDVVSIERHPTIYKENRNKVSYKKINKRAKKEYKVSYRNVEKITPLHRHQPISREFFSPDIKTEVSGYWKKIDFHSSGVDKNGLPIQGRTWVNKTLTWKESQVEDVSLKVIRSQIEKSSDNHGYIYLMRCAAHEKNIYKIGLTTRTSEVRSKELSKNTSSVDHFLVAEDWEVSDCKLAEKMIHEKLAEYRVNPKREFFQVDYRVIFKAMHEVIESIDGNL